ncbi:MAG: tetratricopeptide repeat protein, partial [Oscillospiraceae bacterium]|nr:tetratricopeptide repeat protein [Oscillospiraceae bacterium]
RMETYARKTSRYAKEAIRLSPNEKGCQWMLQKSEGHAAWDWNVSNHTAAVEFYQELARDNPDSLMCCYYLIDNLIADRRADEAEKVLERMCAIKNSRHVTNEVYRAHIALARFDEAAADKTIEELVAGNGDDSVTLFEAAQYYAKKCDYEKAIEYYERSFANEPRRPRFQDELMGIADIYQVMGDYKKAAETYDRIIDLLENEWGLTEETELQDARRIKARLLEKA